MTQTAQQTVKEIFDQDEKKDLLRLVTAGSVDDGKSTLIGRLLYESHGIYEDQLEAVEKASAVGSTGGELDLALVTDGLRAEREQGITIDVAYRYFSTPKRKFIIADTPGHEQYTRNMATGASTANLSIILIDARKGVLTQSKRHAFIASLLNIPHMLVAVNKMDAVDYDEKVFRDIVDEFSEFCTKLEISDVTFIPISALVGDNVVDRSSNMDWYQGTTLLNHLETVHIASDVNLIDLRFPVQWVNRPDMNFRGFAGTLASGLVRPGDDVMVLPSGKSSRIKQVVGPDGEVNEGYAPMPLTLTLEDEIDVSRGDMLVHPNNQPRVDRTFEAMVVWMSEQPMEIGKQYTIKQATKLVPGVVNSIRYQINVNTLHRNDATQLELNEIGQCRIDLGRPMAFDPYRSNRTTGSFIIIDKLTNNTVGAGMILEREKNELLADESLRVTTPRSTNVHTYTSNVTDNQRQQLLNQKPATIWLTGLHGSGKRKIAYALEKKLHELGHVSHVLDSATARLGLNKDLAFSADDRSENVRRAAEVAKLFNQAGLISICSFLSPNQMDRQKASEIIGIDQFIEIYISAPLKWCRANDSEGIYAQADSGEIKHYTGVTAPYQEPTSPMLSLPTHELDTDTCVTKIIDLLWQNKVISDK